MKEEMLESPAPDNKPENRSNLRFKTGVCLLIINIPMGLMGAAFAGVLALKTGHKAFWAGIGIAIYALSWGMLGMGLVLSGKEGKQYAKELGKKWFKRGN